MIVQWLLDVIGVFFAGVLDLIPDSPDLDGILSGIGQGIDGINGLIEPLGVLVPFNVVAIIVGGWVAVSAYWIGTLVFRVITFLVKM